MSNNTAYVIGSKEDCLAMQDVFIEMGWVVSIQVRRKNWFSRKYIIHFRKP